MQRTLHGLLVLGGYLCEDLLALRLDVRLQLLVEHPLHVCLLEQSEDLAQVGDVPLVHHPRKSALCALQQALSALHHQDLQHVPDHQLFDRLETVEVVRSLLLQLDVVPRSLEVLGCGELHHACDELAVLRLQVLGEARDEVLLEAGSVVGVFGLLVSLVPASGGVLESAVHLDHVN